MKRGLLTPVVVQGKSSDILASLSDRKTLSRNEQIWCADTHWLGYATGSLNTDLGPPSVFLQTIMPQASYLVTCDGFLVPSRPRMPLRGKNIRGQDRTRTRSIIACRVDLAPAPAYFPESSASPSPLAAIPRPSARTSTRTCTRTAVAAAHICRVNALSVTSQITGLQQGLFDRPSIQIHR
ncbi:hypothetical protein OH76DRAFT_1028883 [Lentinus brumalis]|uniref:Uncharacterized protein n=1 Tax=Lentinus brumalis TaxID=2498619 RepID=A0A371CXT4_9APHY|nr:hypothetical protein OH76DRAFT_1028883 [Polyporus brumalis]